MLVSLISFTCRVLCQLLGSFYPAYASYRAVLSRDAEEHKQWLCYWVVNSLFVVAELFSDLLSWLPLYWEAKLALIIWLTFYRGATVIYDNLVHKYLERFEPEIDAKLNALQQSADAAFEGLKARAVRHLQRGSRTILQAGGAALAELAMASATAAALEGSEVGLRARRAPLPEANEADGDGDIDNYDDASSVPAAPSSGVRRR